MNLKKMMKEAIEELDLDCSVCTFFKETIAYYKCLYNEEHVIDDIVPICNEFRDKRKKIADIPMRILKDKDGYKHIF